MEKMPSQQSKKWQLRNIFFARQIPTINKDIWGRRPLEPIPRPSLKSLQIPGRNQLAFSSTLDFFEEEFWLHLEASFGAFPFSRGGSSRNENDQKRLPLPTPLQAGSFLESEWLQTTRILEFSVDLLRVPPLTANTHSMTRRNITQPKLSLKKKVPQRMPTNGADCPMQ